MANIKDSKATSHLDVRPLFEALGAAGIGLNLGASQVHPRGINSQTPTGSGVWSCSLA